MFTGKGNTQKPFDEPELLAVCREGLAAQGFGGKRVLVVIPDTTRSGPTGFFFRAICDTLLPLAKKLDFLVALGTHPVISDERLNAFLGITPEQRRDQYGKAGIFQHHWDKPEELTHIGTISAAEISAISNGLLSEEIPVTINKKVLEYDVILLVGPVFPHEVVGMSGGYKYLFPGISGPQFLHKFHWLGALITNPKINGTKDTPVRAAINRAVKFLPTPISLLCYAVKEKKVHGLYAGGLDAWSAAADLSARMNIRYVKRTYHTVLAQAPHMYDDIWTAGKCMYKLEPVVADGGKLIIYAPHITVVSYTHGKEIDRVGYHTRDYFVCQCDRFPDVPGGIMAHSTHVKGIGTYVNGVEKPRVEVILATGIPPEECRRINLGYMDPARINVEEYAGREDEGILLVREAGEVLYRLEDGTVPDVDKLT